jgi:hypothetical protein
LTSAGCIAFVTFFIGGPGRFALFAPLLAGSKQTKTTPSRLIDALKVFCVPGVIEVTGVTCAGVSLHRAKFESELVLSSSFDGNVSKEEAQK